MKRIRLIQAAVLLAVTVTAVSCTTSRGYYDNGYRSGVRTDVSLVINPGPGFVVSRYPDGRYYYRDPRGYVYWRGYRNQYYLDRRYVNRSYHNHRQYNDWRRYYRRGR